MENSKRKPGGRKLLALMLSVILVITMVPTAVFAEGSGSGEIDWDWGDETTHVEYTDANGVSGWPDMPPCPEAKYHADDGHIWDTKSYMTDTCTSKGVHEERCLYCGAIRYTYEKPSGHQKGSRIVDESLAPTCTAAGYNTYYCRWHNDAKNPCDARIVEPVPALGHYWILNEQASLAPTVKDQGHNDYYCDRCGATKSDPVPALGGYVVPKFAYEVDPKYIDGGSQVHSSHNIEFYGRSDNVEFVSESYGLLNVVIKDSVNHDETLKKDMIVLTAQELWEGQNYPASFRLADGFCDITVDTTQRSKCAKELAVYLVGFGITSEGGRATKGIRNITVKGDNVSVYLVNSNIGFIDYKYNPNSENYSYHVFDGSEPYYGVSVIVDGFKSYLFMGPDCNAGINAPEIPANVAVNSNLPEYLDYNPGDKNKFWWNDVAHYASDYKQRPTVELSNLTIRLMGIPAARYIDENGGIKYKLYQGETLIDTFSPHSSSDIRSGVFDRITGAVLNNCKWSIEQIDLYDFSQFSVYNLESSYTKDYYDYYTTLYLHNRSELTLSGSSTLDVIAKGTNTIKLDNASMIKGRITAADGTDDMYGAFRFVGFHDGYPELKVDVDDHAYDQYIGENDPIYHSIELQPRMTVGETTYASQDYSFTGADLTLLLAGESLVWTRDHNDRTPDIMVDGRAVLTIKDDPDTEGVGSVTVGDMHDGYDLDHWGVAAIGGTPSMTPRPHGWIRVQSGVVSASAYYNGAAIGGSPLDPMITYVTTGGEPIHYDGDISLIQQHHYVSPAKGYVYYVPDNTQFDPGQYPDSAHYLCKPYQSDDYYACDFNGEQYYTPVVVTDEIESATPGYSRNGGWVTITGGVVNTKTTQGAGIGGALGGNGGIIEIKGGTVNAEVLGMGQNAAFAAGIGGGVPVYNERYLAVGSTEFVKDSNGRIIYSRWDETENKYYYYYEGTEADEGTIDITLDADGYQVYTFTPNDGSPSLEVFPSPDLTNYDDENYSNAVYIKYYDWVSGGGSGSIDIVGGSVVSVTSPDVTRNDAGKPIENDHVFYVKEKNSDFYKELQDYDLWIWDESAGTWATDGDGNYLVKTYYDLSSRIREYSFADGRKNGKWVGYMIGSACGERNLYKENTTRIISSRGVAPLLIMRQTGDSRASSWDNYYLPNSGRQTDQRAFLPENAGTYIEQWYYVPSLIRDVVMLCYGMEENGSGQIVPALRSNLTGRAYKVHGNIDLYSLTDRGMSLTLPDAATLTLGSGTVLNVGQNFTLLCDEDQLVVEDGSVIQGKGMWPGKPADPENPPTADQIRSMIERMSERLQSGETGEVVAYSHLGIVQAASGKTVIPGYSGDDIRQQMKRFGMTENMLLTVFNAGDYGFKSEKNGTATEWKLNSYDSNTVVSLVENGALSAAPGKHMLTGDHFDVILVVKENDVVVTLKSAKLATPEYTVFDGRADEEITNDKNGEASNGIVFGSPESEFAFTINLTSDQVLNNKSIFSVPKFSGSEFKVSRISPLKDKCAVRYGGTMKFVTPVSDIAGITINELQLKYGSKLALDGIDGGGFVKVPSIGGFPVKGSASLYLNTFAPNRELSLEINLDTPIFSGQFEGSFKEARGYILLDTLYAELAVEEGGIPLVPPTVIGYIQGGGLGFKGLADTVNMDSFGAPPIRLEMAAKGSIIDVIDGTIRLSLGPSGFDMRLTDIKIADANFIKEMGISAGWDAGEKTINGIKYWGINTKMSQYLVIAVPIKSYGGYANSENGVIGGISATGTIGFGGFAGYAVKDEDNGKFLYFIYQLNASGSLAGSVTIPKGFLFGKIPFQAIKLLDAELGFYAAVNVTNTVNADTIDTSGSASSIIRQLAKNTNVSFKAAVGAKVSAGVGKAQCNVRVIYVLGDPGLIVDGGTGSGGKLNLESYVNAKAKSNSLVTAASLDGYDEPVPVIVQTGAYTVASGGTMRGSADEFTVIPQEDGSVTVYIPNDMGGNVIVALTLDQNVLLGENDLTVTDELKNRVTLESEVYDAEGTPTDPNSNFYAEKDVDLETPDGTAIPVGMVYFAPAQAGTYNIKLNDPSLSIDEVEAIVTSMYAALDEDSTTLSGHTVNYNVNDLAEDTRYKVQLLMSENRGDGDYTLAESEGLTGTSGSLSFETTGQLAPSGSYYPTLVLLEYVEAEDEAGQKLAAWTAVDQKTFGQITYTNESEIPAPASVSLAYSGNGTMTAGWNAVTGADVYEIAVYEQDEDIVDDEESGMPEVVGYHLEDTGLRYQTTDASTSLVMDMSPEISGLVPGQNYAVGVKAIKYIDKDAQGNYIEGGQYQSGRERVSEVMELKEAQRPAVSYSSNVALGDGNTHTMLVGADEARFTVTGSKALDITVKNQNTGESVAAAAASGWTAEYIVPVQTTNAAGKSVPTVLEILAADPDTGDYALEYISVSYDTVAPPLVLDGLGKYPTWKISAGNYASVTGHSEAGAKVVIYKHEGNNFNYVNGVSAAEDGSFAIPVQFTGTAKYVIQSIDAAGNKSAALTVDFPEADINVNIDTNGGMSSVSSIGITDGSSVGKLPTPTWPVDEDEEVKIFAGWYIESRTIGSLTQEGVTVDNAVITVETDIDSSLMFRKDGNEMIAFVYQNDPADPSVVTENVIARFEGDPVIIARWQDSVMLTYDPGEGARCTVGEIPVNKGAAIGTLPVPVRTDGANVIFIGWFDGSSQVSETSSFSEDTTLTAHWAETVAVTFDAGLGKISSGAELLSDAGAMTVIKGGTITAYPAASANGYAFQGWYLDLDGENEQLADTSTVFGADTRLTAKWTRNIEQLAVTQQGCMAGEALADPVYTAPEGMVGTPTITYTRSVSYTDSEGAAKTKTYVSSAKPTEAGDYTVTVQCDTKNAAYVGSASFNVAKAPHAVSIASGIENGSISADVQTAFEGDTVTVTAVPSSEGNGYALAQLTVTDGSGKPVEVEMGVGGDSNVCSFTMPDDEVTVSAVFAQKVVLSATAVGLDSTLSGIEITPDGPLCAGREVTLAASYKAGYEFIGWFSGENKVSTNLVYTFVIEQDTTLVAQYQARGTASVNISAVGGEFTLPGSSTAQTNVTDDYQLGTELTITAVDPDKVLQWENESNKVLGRGPSLTVTVTGSMSLKLVCKGSENVETAYTQFVSDYGQVLMAKTYSINDVITLPDSPTKLGHTFIKWVFENTDAEAKEDTIKSRMSTESTITVKPNYSKNAIVYSITVQYEGVTRTPEIYADHEIGSGLTVIAPEISGKQFSCWKRGDEILSYKPEYFIQIAGNDTLTACYVSETAQVTVQPVITLSELIAVEEGTQHKVAGTATRSIPDGYTLIEHGLLWAKDFASPTADNFQYGKAGVNKYISNTTSQNGTVKLNVKVADDSTVVTLRGYMILRDSATGNEVVYYTEIRSRSYSGN